MKYPLYLSLIFSFHIMAHRFCRVDYAKLYLLLIFPAYPPSPPLIVSFSQIPVGPNRNSLASISILYPIFFKLSARVIFFKKQLFYQSINNQSHSILLRFKEDIVIFLLWKRLPVYQHHQHPDRAVYTQYKGLFDIGCFGNDTGCERIRTKQGEVSPDAHLHPYTHW